MEVAVVNFMSGVQGGKMPLTAVAVVVLVTMETDVGLLSDPGGCDVG